MDSRVSLKPLSSKNLKTGKTRMFGISSSHRRMLDKDLDIICNKFIFHHIAMAHVIIVYFKCTRPLFTDRIRYNTFDMLFPAARQILACLFYSASVTKQLSDCRHFLPCMLIYHYLHSINIFLSRIHIICPEMQIVMSHNFQPILWKTLSTVCCPSLDDIVNIKYQKNTLFDQFFDKCLYYDFSKLVTFCKKM